MIGPIVVGLLAVAHTPVGPVLPLGCAVLLLVAAGVPFARRYADPTSGSGDRAGRSSPIPIGALIGLMAGMAVVGAVFGTTQTGVTWYAAAQGQPALAGPLYALLALGNTGAGLACARLPQRIGLELRYLIFATGLLVGTTVLAAGATGLLPLPVAMLIGGASIAPYMITLFRLAGQLCPGRTATVLTAVGAGGAFGTGAALALAGRLAPDQGAAGAFLVAPTAAAIGLGLAALYVAGRRRAARCELAGTVVRSRRGPR